MDTLLEGQVQAWTEISGNGAQESGQNSATLSQSQKYHCTGI